MRNLKWRVGWWEISHQSLDQIVGSAFSLISETSRKNRKAWFLLLSPIVVDRKGEFSNLFDNLKAKGFRQVRVDGYVKDLSEDLVLIKTNKHTIEAVIDRIAASGSNLKDKIFSENLKGRLSDSIQQALNLSDGTVVLAQVLDSGFELPEFPKKFTNHLFSEKFACPIYNIFLSHI